MTMNELDTRGRSCPEPVILTQQALAGKPDKIKILADSAIAKDNIVRFAQGKGYKIEVKEEGPDFALILTK